MTLVVNFYGGPGSGKSTLAAGVFYELKQKGINCELAREYAKDIVWRGTEVILEDQIYVFAKQRRRIKDLEHKVDIIVTDSPILMSLIYGEKESHWFKELVKHENQKHNNLNMFVQRDPDRPYNPSGRYQTEEQAMLLDLQMANMLSENDQPYKKVIANDPSLVLWFIKEKMNG